MDRVDAICMTVHEAIRAWAMANGQPAIPDWADAPDWMKQSTRQSVENVMAHPHQTARDQHDQWLGQKQAAGWRHGDTKSETDRTHPMMVPFDDLPEFEKKKDDLVKAIVRALAE